MIKMFRQNQFSVEELVGKIGIYLYSQKNFYYFLFHSLLAAEKGPCVSLGS